MKRGELVPDELVGTMLMRLLHTQPASGGCVYDGYPRTTAQAAVLDRVLAELVRRVDAVLYLAVPDELIVGRMSGRRSCPACGAVYHVTAQPPAGSRARATAVAVSSCQREDDREAGRRRAPARRIAATLRRCSTSIATAGTSPR